MSTPSAFDQVVKALRNSTLQSALCCKQSTKPQGEIGERILTFNHESFDRDLITDTEYLISTITDKLDIPCSKLLVKKPRDADGGGKHYTLVIGNIKGEPSTHWALVAEGFVLNLKDFDPDMDFKVLESKETIEQFITWAKAQDLLSKAQEIANLVDEATQMKPERLLALRQALGQVDNGSQILQVWDSVAVGKDLETTTPKARRGSKSPRL